MYFIIIIIRIIIIIEGKSEEKPVMYEWGENVSLTIEICVIG